MYIHRPNPRLTELKTLGGLFISKPSWPKASYFPLATLFHGKNFYTSPGINKSSIHTNIYFKTIFVISHSVM